MNLVNVLWLDSLGKDLKVLLGVSNLVGPEPLDEALGELLADGLHVEGRVLRVGEEHGGSGREGFVGVDLAGGLELGPDALDFLLAVSVTHHRGEGSLGLLLLHPRILGQVLQLVHSLDS